MSSVLKLTVNIFYTGLCHLKARSHFASMSTFLSVFASNFNITSEETFLAFAFCYPCFYYFVKHERKHWRWVSMPVVSLSVFTSPSTQSQRNLLKGCSYCTIALAIWLSQLMRCMGFSVIVTIARCEHLHWIPYKPFVVIRKNRNRNRNRTMWTILKFGCWRNRYVWTRQDIVSRKTEMTAQTNYHCQSYYTGSRYQRVKRSF